MKAKTLAAVLTLALAGCYGPGAEGPEGPQGLTGATGAQGPAGDAGAPGVATLALTQYYAQSGYCGTIDPTTQVLTYGSGTLVILFEDVDGNGRYDQPPDKVEGSFWACNGQPGEQGPAGDAGAVGPQGPAGDAGAIGPQGPVGTAGPLGVVAVISPCNTPATDNESFLGLGDGSLIAVWSDGPSDTHLVDLANGTFVTTDGTGCVFTLSGTVPGVRTLTPADGSLPVVTWGQQ